MAKIPWPVSDRYTVDLLQTSLGLSYPGQIIHTSPYTGAQTIINRSTGLWRGNVTFKPVVTTDGSSKDVQKFLNLLGGASNTFEVPLISTTLPAIKVYNTVASFAELNSRQVGWTKKRPFPYFTEDLMFDDESDYENIGRVIEIPLGDLRSSAILTPTVPVNTSDYFYISVWAWANYRAFTPERRHSKQLYLGCIYYDDDDNVLSQGSLGFSAKNGPLFLEQYSVMPGWNEYAITLGTGLPNTVHVGATKLRLYVSFVDYLDTDISTGGSSQSVRLANLGLWNLPYLSSNTGNVFTTRKEINLPSNRETEPFYCKVLTQFHDRLVQVQKTGDREYTIDPAVTPRGNPNPAFYLRPAWSVESRLVQQTNPVVRAPDFTQEMSLDFVEVL